MFDEEDRKFIAEGAKLIRSAADELENPELSLDDLQHLTVAMYHFYDGFKSIALTAHLKEMRRNYATAGSQDNGSVEDHA